MENSNSIQIFNNPDFGDVRTILIDGEPWFCGKDIASALGYAKERNAVQKYVDREDALKRGIPTNSGIQEMTIINESGLYSLIFGSKLESAKKFKKWVTSEVLPSLRKTGTYSAQKQIPMTIPAQIQLLAQGYTEMNLRVDTLSERMDKFEADLPVLPIDAERISRTVKRIGALALGGKGAKAYKNRSLSQKVFMDIYGELKRQFGVRSYKEIKRNDCGKAIELLEKYELPYMLNKEVQEQNAA